MDINSIKVGDTIFTLRPFVDQGFAIQSDREVNFPYLGKLILDQGYDDITDVIATSDELCIFCDTKDLHRIKSILADMTVDHHLPNTYKLPVCFNNDIEWNAIYLSHGINKKDYVKQICQAQLKIDMYGFIPGFVYMSGVDPVYQIPRKSKPKTNNQPSVLAAGGPYIGIHNIPSPTGWYILGQIPVTTFTMHTEVNMYLAPGDIVQIVDISQEEFDQINRKNITLAEYNEY